MSGTDPDGDWFDKKGDPTNPFKPDDFAGAGPGGTTPGDLPKLPGITLHYEIARGGMGVVYSGRQDFLDRRVAVKFLSVELGGEAFAKRFQREAKILAGISHQNIVGCHMADTTPEGQSYLVMEFIDGPSLKAWIGENGPVPALASLRLIRATAAALAHAHLSDIIHRDVKPENILLESVTSTAIDITFPFTPKLVDLGLARMTHEQVGMGLTSPGSVMGTPATMSPEQFDDPDSVDFRSDIYGLGCCLYEMLVGHPAFRGNKLTDIVLRKREKVAPNPCDENPAIPAAVGAFTQRLLASDRDDRPASYKDLDQEIGQLIEALAHQGNRTDTVVGMDAEGLDRTIPSAPGPFGGTRPARPTPTPTPTPPGSPPPSEPKQTAPGMLNTGELDFLSEGVPPKAEAPAFQESGGAAAGGTVVTPAADTASVTRPEGDGGGNGARLGMIAGAAVLVLGTVAFLVFGGDGDPDGDRSGDGDVGTAGNRPPTAVTMIGTEAVDLGGTFELQASASDPDGDPLRYTWKFPSECMAALSSTDSNSIRLRLLDGLPDVELRVTCLADDGHEGHAPAVGNFDVTVGACPMTMPLFGWKKGGWTERGGCFWSQPMSNPEVPTMFHAAGRVRSGPGALETSLGSEVYWEWSGLLRPSDMPGEGDEDLPGRGTVTLLFGERGYRFVCGLDDGETKWSIELQERVPGTEEWRPMAERYERKWKQPDSDNEHRAAWSIRRERDRLVLQLGEFVQPIPPGGGDLPEPVYARNVPVPIVLDEAGVAALNDGRLLLGVEQARCAFHVTRR